MPSIRSASWHLVLSATTLVLTGCQAGPGGIGGGISSLWNGSRETVSTTTEEEVVTVAETEDDEETSGESSQVGAGQQSGQLNRNQQQNSSSTSPLTLMRGAGGSWSSSGGFGRNGFGASGGGGYSGGFGLGLGGGPGGGGSAGDVTLAQTLAQQGSGASLIADLNTSPLNNAGTLSPPIGPTVPENTIGNLTDPSPPELPGVAPITGSDLIVPIDRPETVPIILSPGPQNPPAPLRAANPEPSSLMLLAMGMLALLLFHLLPRKGTATTIDPIM